MEQKEFSPLGVNFHFYANYVSKFFFVLAPIWRQYNQPIIGICQAVLRYYHLINSKVSALFCSGVCEAVSGRSSCVWLKRIFHN